MKNKFSFFALLQWLILLVALGAATAYVAPLSGALYALLIVALSLACIQFAQVCSDFIGRRPAA